VETCAADGLFRIFGLASGEQNGDFIVPNAQSGLFTRREENRVYDGKQYFADRFIIPLTGLPGGYTAEFLLDASERVLGLRQRESEYVQMLKILVNMFEIKDPYSQGHSEVVSHLAQELAVALSLPETEVNTISKAALLHDIGKIIIPPEILGKVEELTATEHEKIQAHASVGADILSGMKLFQEEAVIVRHHHERFDGYGYPGGLYGRNIPLGSRIIAVVDAFDAMTAGRSARGKRDITATFATLEIEKGGQFDPEIVETFITMVRAERAARQ
jgi:putative nucleotidyltransferase with HDIG domain